MRKGLFPELTHSELFELTEAEVGERAAAAAALAEEKAAAREAATAERLARQEEKERQAAEEAEWLEAVRAVKEGNRARIDNGEEPLPLPERPGQAADAAADEEEESSQEEDDNSQAARRKRESECTEAEIADGTCDPDSEGNGNNGNGNGNGDENDEGEEPVNDDGAGNGDGGDGDGDGDGPGNVANVDGQGNGDSENQDPPAKPRPAPRPVQVDSCKPPTKEIGVQPVQKRLSMAVPCECSPKTRIKKVIKVQTDWSEALADPASEEFAAFREAQEQKVTKRPSFKTRTK